MDFIVHKRQGNFHNTERMQAFNESLPDGSYLVSITPTKKRTTDQNAYYWGIVVPMVHEGLRDMGYDEVKTKEDAHLVLRSLFLKKHIGELELVRSTTELKTTEFSTYLEEIGKWAAEYLNVVIPAPNTQLEMYEN